MSVTEQISARNNSRTIEMLANVPRPSGDGHTRACDYGQKIVCQQAHGRASFFEQDAKQNISITTICTAIGEVAIENPVIEGTAVVEIFSGGSFASYFATATAPVNRESLTLNSIENWIPKNAVKLNSSKFEVTDEILRFCFRHYIVKHLRPIISLIEKSFPAFQEPCLEIEEDPESDEEWLTIDITVEGEVDEILECYNNYITAFVSSVPWPEREKIRLSYNII